MLQTAREGEPLTMIPAIGEACIPFDFQVVRV